jgi:hypothetical protein
MFRELRLLPSDTVGFALGINDLGRAVVGASVTCSNTSLVPLQIGPHAVSVARPARDD